jgi:SpoVK/Ycf46/Vps4 family AAA+-type ATPase
VVSLLGQAVATRTTNELRSGLDLLEPELSGALAVWDARGSDPSPEDYPRAARWLARSTGAGVAVLDLHHDAPEISDRVLIELRVDAESADERHLMWTALLEHLGVTPDSNEVARRLSARCRAGAGLATRAARAPLSTESNEPREVTRALETALGALVQPSSTRGVVVEMPGPESSLSSLIVCDSVSRALGHLLVLAEVRETAPDPVRRGVKAMFTGPSGTGKTLAARAIARELGLPLFRVDLAALVSKWLGETEKNLRHAFDAAESSGALLLFDEGDALFGKRGEVERGTDRYANLEVSFLLQALEAHDGIVIVTTNLKAQIDRAFLRRFDVCVEFHPPTRPERVLLWRRELGSAGDALDERFLNRELAQIDLTGGNVAAASRLARALAERRGEKVVRREDLNAAVESELTKLGAGATAARWAARASDQANGGNGASG